MMLVAFAGDARREAWARAPTAVLTPKTCVLTKCSGYAYPEDRVVDEDGVMVGGLLVGDEGELDRAIGLLDPATPAVWRWRAGWNVARPEKVDEKT